MPLPTLPTIPDGMSLVLRTDFTDDAAWEALKTALDRADPYRDEVTDPSSCAYYVSDPAYSGATVEDLVEAERAAAPGDKSGGVFVADATALSGGEHTVLVVDLFDDGEVEGCEPGRS